MELYKQIMQFFVEDKNQTMPYWLPHRFFKVVILPPADQLKNKLEENLINNLS